MQRVAALFAVIVLAIGAVAQSSDQLSGEWRVRRDIYGNPRNYHRITFKLEDGKVSGTFASGRKLEGTLQGNVLHFTSREGPSTIECVATINGNTISGKFIETNMNNPKD